MGPRWAVVRQREAGLRKAFLNNLKRAQSAFDVVEGLKNTVVQKHRTKAAAGAINKFAGFQHVEDRAGVDIEAGENIHQETGGRDHAIKTTDSGQGRTPVAQMILGLAIVVIQDDFLAVELGEEEGR